MKPQTLTLMPKTYTNGMSRIVGLVVEAISLSTLFQNLPYLIMGIMEIDLVLIA